MNSSQATPAAERILSLDVFRGLTMAFMVLVGNPGSSDIFEQLDHAPWHGWTVTDAVFPTFLWVVGLSLYLSFTRRRARGEKPSGLLKQSSKRCMLLFVIGVGIYAIADSHLATFRVLGVLQRIAICSFATSISYFLPRRSQIVLIAAILAGYWLLLSNVAAPGFHAGDLSVDGNLAHYVDRVALGRHNYSGTGTWDPEGILSTFPAIATTLFGLIAGKLVLNRNKTISSQAVLLCAMGTALIGAGLACSHWQPINKKLWTVSYCLLMAGIDYGLFGLMRWVIDGKRVRHGLTVPLAFGQNALAVYILSESVGALLLRVRVRGVSAHELLFNAVFRDLASPKISSLLFALAYLSIVTAVAVTMYRRRWILKL
ncbi:MAG: DUF1624 domain-containing protein [Acidobacteria bacterium]|nr:DUF1624 domain-containing protein [Acidobacteriota bacterium]